MPINIPNLLTWLRILLIPVFVSFFYLSNDTLSPHLQNVISTCVFLLAALTDWLDGYLARKLDQFSAFGAFLDPVADKLMVCCRADRAGEAGTRRCDHRFHHHRARDHDLGVARMDGTAGRKQECCGFHAGQDKNHRADAGGIDAAVSRQTLRDQLPGYRFMAVVSGRIADDMVDGLLPDARDTQTQETSKTKLIYKSGSV